VRTQSTQRARGATRLATAAALALLAWTFAPTPVIANDSSDAEEPAGTWAPDSSASINFSLLNRYVWRGLLVTDGPVVQPVVEVEHRGFFVNVWGNMDLDDVNGNEREFNEIDLTFGYSHDFRLVSVTGALIHYTFPSTLFEDTTEIVGSAAFDVLLSPTISAYLDVDAASGGRYWDLGIGHGFEMPGIVPWSVELELGLGWGSSEHNELYFGVGEAHFTDVLATVTVPVDLSRGWTLTPSAAYSSVIGSELRDAVIEPDNFIAGVSVTYDF
jgi:hypothetical protein